MGAWNLSRFAEALLPLLHENKNEAVKLAEKEIENYWERYNENWLNGMRKKIPTQETRIEEFLSDMEKNKLDFTNTFRNLSSENPAVIPRNHRVEEALTAAEHGDFSVMHKLLAALRNPYEASEYSAPPAPATCRYKTFCGT
jgi:uncharacterized protein YdiU (UPF0061 family)